MVIGIINTANEIQILSLDKYKLTVQKLRPIKPKIFTTELKDIQSIKMKNISMNPFSIFANFRYMMKMQSSFAFSIEVPAIITAYKTKYFFDEANDAEQEWVTNILDGLVKRLRK